MFSIFHGILLGEAGGRSISVSAVSGGGGGSTRPGRGWVDAGVVNNPSQTGLKTIGKGSAHRHGGPLPAGWYTIARPEANHEGKGRWASLVPFRENVMLGRDGMAIHGPGPHGSDGCIVPPNPSDFQLLMDALEADGGGVLQVLPFWLAPGGVGR